MRAELRAAVARRFSLHREEATIVHVTYRRPRHN